MRLNTGDVFEVGQVWESPRGLLWEVLKYEVKPGKKKQVVLRTGGKSKTGYNQRRDWDAVEGWVIHQHAPSNGEVQRQAR